MPSGVIAVWGKLQLQPLDGAALAALDASSDSAQDMLVDPLGDLKRSLELKLPVYRLAGGAGYLWSAAHTNGRGHLRFLMADPSALVAKPPAPAAMARPKTLAIAHPGGDVGWNCRGRADAGTHRQRRRSIRRCGRNPSPDHAVPMPPRTEIERAIVESERVAPEHTGSIADVPAGAADEAPTPPAPSLHRLESILALAGVAAILLFFLASLIERLVREPTGLELLELERQRELAAELEEQRQPKRSPAASSRKAVSPRSGASPPAS